MGYLKGLLYDPAKRVVSSIRQNSKDHTRKRHHGPDHESDAQTGYDKNSDFAAAEEHEQYTAPEPCHATRMDLKTIGISLLFCASVTACNKFALKHTGTLASSRRHVSNKHLPVKAQCQVELAVTLAVHSGWSQDPSNTATQLHAHAQRQPTSSWAAGTGFDNSHQTTAISHQGTAQSASNTVPEATLCRQAPILKPELSAKKQLTKDPVIIHRRPADNLYDSVSFGQQQQEPQVWLQGVSRCLNKLAEIRADAQPQHVTLTVPWAWIARDLIHLLPVDSCYSYFVEDDELFCQLLQQLTADNVDTLSQPGAQMMADIIGALAQHAPGTLAEYIEASPAVLQRIRQVCTALCNSNMDSDAAEYALNVAGCLLAHHKAGVRCTRKQVQQALKSSLLLLLLLPQDVQSSACTKLMESQQSFQASFLNMEDLTEPLGQSRICLAVKHLERLSTGTKRASQKEVGKMCEWAIWTAAPTDHNAQLLQNIQLAVYVSQLLQQAKSAKLYADTLSPVNRYILAMAYGHSL